MSGIIITLINLHTSGTLFYSSGDLNNDKRWVWPRYTHVKYA